MKKVTRRTFIKYGLVTGAGLGVAQLPGSLVEAAELVGNLPRTERYDVVVIGTGLAGMVAAISAAENGAKVALIEKQQKALAGGNSALAGGAFTVPQADTQEAKDLFYEECMKKNGYRADPALTRSVVDHSLEGIAWLRAHGADLPEAVPLNPYRVKCITAAPGQFRGMPKLLATLRAAAAKVGVTEYYRMKAKDLLIDASGKVVGLRAMSTDGLVDFRAKAVIIASGGYAANPQMLEQWVGPDADESLVRGVKWATGDGLQMAEKAGAALVQMGGLDSLHIAAVHVKNTASGNPSRLIPFSLGINKLGQRYVDESRGYVSHGKAAMNQPGAQVAIVFDQAIANLPEGKMTFDNFNGLGIEILKASTLSELAAKIDVPVEAFLKTVSDFNASVKDGKALTANPPKAAAAMRIENPPFYAIYPMRPGITLTFGGIRVNVDRQVLEPDGTPIKGLYAAGECVGGHFLVDYMSGGSLTRCTVDGRIAGVNAAKEA
ncbi:MAG: FAD-dependent oxidoreductase [Betaproteobacteria bacterium]